MPLIRHYVPHVFIYISSSLEKEINSNLTIQTTACYVLSHFYQLV